MCTKLGTPTSHYKTCIEFEKQSYGRYNKPWFEHANVRTNPDYVISIKFSTYEWAPTFRIINFVPGGPMGSLAGCPRDHLEWRPWDHMERPLDHMERPMDTVGRFVLDQREALWTHGPFGPIGPTGLGIREPHITVGPKPYVRSNKKSWDREALHKNQSWGAIGRTLISSTSLTASVLARVADVILKS